LEYSFFNAEEPLQGRAPFGTHPDRVNPRYTTPSARNVYQVIDKTRTADLVVLHQTIDHLS